MIVLLEIAVDRRFTSLNFQSNLKLISEKAEQNFFVLPKQIRGSSFPVGEGNIEEGG